jgi:hypothetical protein
MLLKNTSKIEKDRTLPNLFHEVSFMPIPKLGKDEEERRKKKKKKKKKEEGRRKEEGERRKEEGEEENYKSIFLLNTDVNILNKILVN